VPPCRQSFPFVILATLAFVLGACSGAPTGTSAPPTVDPLTEAETALSAFFEALAGGRFAEATRRYGGPYDYLQENNPDVDPEDHAALLERWCTQNGGQCLRVLEVLRRERYEGSRFGFTVQFAAPDGGLFEVGPCCGEEDTGQRTSEFLYTVEAIEGGYRILELPPYVP
jgi:hypothetical protein